MGVADLGVVCRHVVSMDIHLGVFSRVVFPLISHIPAIHSSVIIIYRVICWKTLSQLLAPFIILHTRHISCILPKEQCMMLIDGNL